MGYYDKQVVCLNGHQITDRLSTCQKQTTFCNECGAPGLSKCEECGQSIRGYYHQERVLDLTGRTAPIPKNCEHCGKPFPWREKLLSREVQQTPPFDRLKKILMRFHSVARQLRARHDSRDTLNVTDEYDVQDLLHALLRLEFDDIRPEEWTPSYAGKSSRMDFLLKCEQIVVEVKLARKGLADAQVGDQLIVDIERYQQHPDCETLVCFVYDPEGHIRNPRGLSQDLSRESQDLGVSVIVAPASE